MSCIIHVVFSFRKNSFPANNKTEINNNIGNEDSHSRKVETANRNKPQTMQKHRATRLRLLQLRYQPVPKVNMTQIRKSVKV
jgi:hypothetical protein